MKKFLSTIGSWLGGVAFLIVLSLLLIFGGKIAAVIEPWVSLIAALGLLIILPISLVLLIFRKTRGWGGMGIYLASWPLALSLWLGCLLYALNVSFFWAIVGLIFAGIGVIPVAGIMAIIGRDWSSLGSLVLSVVIVMVLGGVGSWIMEKAEDQKLADLLANSN